MHVLWKKSKQNEFFHMENVARIINLWAHDNKGHDQLSEQKQGSRFRPLFKRNWQIQSPGGRFVFR